MGKWGRERAGCGREVETEREKERGRERERLAPNHTASKRWSQVDLNLEPALIPKHPVMTVVPNQGRFCPGDIFAPLSVITTEKRCYWPL